jgi:hypothetical protein
MDPAREAGGVENGLRREACDPGLLDGIRKIPVAGGVGGGLRDEAGDAGPLAAILKVAGELSGGGADRCIVNDAMSSTSHTGK